jgi:hypothetical protein
MDRPVAQHKSVASVRRCEVVDGWRRKIARKSQRIQFLLHGNDFKIDGRLTFFNQGSAATKFPPSLEIVGPVNKSKVQCSPFGDVSGSFHGTSTIFTPSLAATSDGLMGAGFGC